MSANVISRVLGLIIFAIIGWLIGTIWAGTSQLTAESLQKILPLSVGGGVIGALIAPWIILRPAAWLRREVRELTLSQLVAATIGLVIGLVIAALVSIPLASLPYPFGNLLPTLAALILAYLGVTVMLLRQQDIFGLFRRRGMGMPVGAALVEAATAANHNDVVLLDTSVIIDGRIADIITTGFIRTPVWVPRFVLNELQYVADSSDALRRNRGRRGLEMLNRMQKESPVPVRIVDMDIEGVRQVDAKLVQLARELNCPIITNDYNLNRVAGLQGVVVLNINELSNAVKAVVLPGETLLIRVIQEGKEAGQGVGYLDDGTMVVVENGRRYIDNEIEVTVTKVLQTNAGRMIFAAPLR
ncbi:MAG: PIN/TRAM domain-containing protein [Anaerolineae bacterium]